MLSSSVSISTYIHSCLPVHKTNFRPKQLYLLCYNNTSIQTCPNCIQRNRFVKNFQYTTINKTLLLLQDSFYKKHCCLCSSFFLIMRMNSCHRPSRSPNTPSLPLPIRQSPRLHLHRHRPRHLLPSHGRSLRIRRPTRHHQRPSIIEIFLNDNLHRYLLRTP